MSIDEFISWTVVLIGAVVCIAGLAKGAMSLFLKKRKDDGTTTWDIDGGGILLAAFIVYVGVQIMIWGNRFPDR